MSQAALDCMPPEIRQCIYDWCLNASTAPIETSRGWDSTSQDVERGRMFCWYSVGGLGLFGVNRALREESIRYFRRVNMFVAVVCYGSPEFAWGTFGSSPLPLIDSLLPVITRQSEGRESRGQFNHCMASIRIQEPEHSHYPPEYYWHCFVVPACVLPAYFSYICPLATFGEFGVKLPLEPNHFRPNFEMSVRFSSPVCRGDIDQVGGRVSLTANISPTMQQFSTLLHAVCHFYPTSKVSFYFAVTRFDEINKKAVNLPLFLRPLPALDISRLARYWFKRLCNRKQMLDTHARCRSYRTRLPHLVDEYSKLVEGIQKCEQDIREIQKVDGWPVEVQQEVTGGQQETTRICQEMRELLATSVVCLTTMDLHRRSIKGFEESNLATCGRRCPCSFFPQVADNAYIPNSVKLRLDHLRALFHFWPKNASTQQFDRLRETLESLHSNAEVNGLEDPDLTHDSKVLQGIKLDSSSNLTRSMRKRARELWPNMSLQANPIRLFGGYGPVPNIVGYIGDTNTLGCGFEIEPAIPADCLPECHERRERERE